MTFQEARLSLQLLAEERVGAPQRALEEAEISGEDNAFAEAQKLMARAR